MLNEIQTGNSAASVAIIGTGYVGLVSGACLADFGNNVTCVDIDNNKIKLLQDGRIPIYEPGLADIVARNTAAKRLQFTDSLQKALQGCEVIFIAVDTPPLEDGSADLSRVENVAREIGRLIVSYRVIVNKSTAPIGTVKNIKGWINEEISKRTEQGETTVKGICFDVVSNPEFLREGRAVQDFTHPDRIVIGADNEKSRAIIKEIYRPLYLNETPFIETNPESAEMIKYASNAFLAVKISYINEIANLCEKTGADINDVARAMGRDGRIGPKFLHPGPGYGGSCFPKDTRAIASIGRSCNARLSIVESAISANEAQKKIQVQKIEAAFGGRENLQNKTAAILGLSFKSNTSDIRESPAMEICHCLAERGMKLRVFDPAAMEEAELQFSGQKDLFYFAANEYDAANGSDALVILTEWNQFRNLDLKKIKTLLREPYFFDLRNIYSREQAEAFGLRYYCTGRP